MGGLVLDGSGWVPVPRSRVDALWSRLSDHRVTTVVAGVGYGKSQLLQSWAERISTSMVTVAPVDRSLAGLAREIVSALRLRVPDLVPPSGVDSAGGPGGGTGTDRIEALAAHVAAALAEHLQRPLVLMVDNVDIIDDSEGAAFLEALIRQAPPQLTFVLSSRLSLPVRLSRLRSQGLVLEVTADDLSFTQDETLALAEVVGASPEAAVAAHRLTGGWPMATRLALAAGLSPREEQGSVAVSGVPLEAAGGLFDFLTEEVMGAEVAPTRAMLAQLALLGSFPPDLAVSIGIAKDHSQLNELRQRGVYIEARPGLWRVLPLIRDFLASPSQALDPVEAAQLRSDAASWYLHRRQPHDALRYAVEVGQPAVVKQVLAEAGSDLVESGSGVTVLDAIARFGAGDRSLGRLLGEAQLFAGDWDAALESFELLAAERQDIDAALAWRMIFILYQRGNLPRALEVFERSLPLEGEAGDRAMAQAWVASVKWVLGDSDGCRKHSEEALKLAIESGDDRALASTYTVQAMLAALDGDRHKNEALYLRALQHAERAGDLLQMLRIHVNRGSRHVEEGAYLESIAETELALEIADLGGFRSFRAMGMANRGEARAKIGRFDEAASDFAEAKAIWEQLNSRQVSYALMAMADVHLVRGDMTLARASFEEARAISAEMGDTQGLVPALTGLALAVAHEDPEAAIDLAREAVEVGPTLGKVAAMLALVGAHQANGNSEAAAAVGVEALELARQRRDRAGMAEALELLVAAEGTDSGRLDEALRIWEELGAPLGQLRTRLHIARSRGAEREEVERIRAGARELGARPLAAAAAQLLDAMDKLTKPRAQIAALGGFQVHRDAVVVGPADWQSKKARDLLKILVARRGRPVSRAVLQDHLWRGDGPEKTANRLSVALSTLRSVLDPDKELDSDHYLLADRESVSLRLDRIPVDLELFHDDAARGFEAARAKDMELAHMLLLRAEARYTGDVFEEDPYEPWALSGREEARTVYVDVARWLANHAIAQKAWDGAGRYLLRILERDHYDERAHLALVRAMIGARRHGEARRLYGQYCARMEELEVEPAPFPQESAE